MKQDVSTSVDPRCELEQPYKAFAQELKPFKAGFDLLRALINQENEQKQRPVARIYSGSRAVKA